MTLVSYTLYHPPADPDDITALIEKLRRKAIDLGCQVSDLVVTIAPRSACYFVATLPDSDSVEIGLAYYSCQVEIDGHPVPFGCPYWMWTGTVRTRDVKTFSLLMHVAARIGIEGFVLFGGTTVVYSRDDDGVVKVEEEADDL